MTTSVASAGNGIVIERDRHVVTIIFNRPQRKNAISGHMWQGIADIFQRIEEDESVRAVILRGEGADFSAGADISEFDRIRGNANAARAYERLNSDAFSAIRDAKVPVIAAIRGICFGGGFGIAAACDIRIASRNALFSVPASRLGLAYPQDAMIDIVSTCGSQMARYLVYSGARISADEAQKTGFLLAVHDFEDVFAAASSMAQTFAENAPLSIRASKAAISAAITASTDMAQLAGRLAAATFDSEDYAEGRAAFREKRKPSFKGK